MIDERFLYVAKQEAGKSNHRRQLGAVCLKCNKVVSKGYNKAKTNPELFNKHGYWTTHAEIDCLAKSRGKGDILLVVRISKNGSMTCGKPCPTCMKFIKKHGIKKIFYSDWDQLIKEMDIT